MKDWPVFLAKTGLKISLLTKISYLCMHQDSRISTVKTFLSRFCELGPNFILFFIGFFRDSPHLNHLQSIWRDILSIYSLSKFPSSLLLSFSFHLQHQSRTFPDWTSSFKKLMTNILNSAFLSQLIRILYLPAHFSLII